VLAEKGEWEKPVLGVSFDGTGYGDDGAIWGGEVFAGSVAQGFKRVAHLRQAALPGGDAAARFPVQAAAGFLDQINAAQNMGEAPFHFPKHYDNALALVRKKVRTFPTTSMGRLFDSAAALLGFTRRVTFEGQAAIWLEQLARSSPSVDPYPFPYAEGEMDFRPLLQSVIQDLQAGRDSRQVARAFQRGIAQGLFDCLTGLTESFPVDTVVCSGGVFQNELLLEDLKSLFANPSFRNPSLQLWTNHVVPANDGGISLGQAALAAQAVDAPAGLV
jgi:hydrogenase maturation protein HypF